MGGSKKQTIGYHYRPAFWVGLTYTIDAFLEFRAADKTAWDGSQTLFNFGPDGYIRPAKYNRHGELITGHVIPATGPLTSSGRIEIGKPLLFGGPKDQGGITGPMDIMFGEPDQMPNPYLQEVFGDQVSAMRGFTTVAFCGGQYGAMNPMPQTPAWKIRKIKKGWDNDDCWYPEKAEISMLAPPVAALYFALDLSGSMDTVTENGQTRLANMKTAINASLDTVAAAVATGTYVDIMVVGFGTYPSTRESITRRAASVGDIEAIKGWVASRTAPYYTHFPAGTMDMPAFFADAPVDAVRVAFFVTDGLPNAGGGGVSEQEGADEAAAHVAASPGVICYGINIDLEMTFFTGVVANAPSGPLVVSGGDPAVLAGIIRDAIFGGLWGVNPAHALYYCRTGGEKGREPRENINAASLTAAADRLYAEGFGLCQLVYDPQRDTPESWEARICRVIGGSFERSLTDGEWHLDLARSDYDVGSLPVIGDDDILDFKELPTTLERAVNSISVRYFDPQRKEQVITPAVRALGLVRQFGEIHETLDFPEIPTADLALRVAERELRARVTPTRAFELTTTPRSKAIRRNQYFRLQTPARGIADVVCIVGERQPGVLKSGAIRWKVATDVYSLPEFSYAEVEQGVDTRPPQHPFPVEHARVLEVPYASLVLALPRSELEALPEDVGYLAGVAAAPAGGVNYTLAVAPEGGEYSVAGDGDWCPTATVVEAAGRLDTEFTLAVGQRLSAVPIGSPVLWDEEICRVDALDLDVSPPAITLGRGCADTVPSEHAAGSRLWFIGYDIAGSSAEYTEGETVEAKFLTNTASQQLPLAAATALPLEFAARQARPYPPGKVEINGEYFPESVLGAPTLTWAHRERVLQADQLVDFFAGDVGPEEGTTYTVENYDESTGQLIFSQDGIEGSQAVVGAIASSNRLELFSVRDGLESTFRHVMMFVGGFDISGIVPGASNLESYAAVIAADGAVAPVIWSISGGSLPSGLHLIQDGSDTASIGGVADAPTGYYEVTIRAEDSNGTVSIRQLEIGVGNIVALLHFDGADNSTTMTDETGRAWSVFGNAKLSASAPAFGSANLLLDGSGDWLQSSGNNAGWSVGTGDFDISAFAKMANISTDQRLWSKYNGGNVPRVGLYWSASANQLRLGYQAHGTAPTDMAYREGAPPVGEWAFISASRRAGQAVVGLDGDYGDGAPMAMSWTVDGPAGIGRFVNSANPWEAFFVGGIDEFKFVSGARINVDGYVPSAPSDYPQPAPALAVNGSLPSGTTATAYSSMTGITIHGSGSPFSVSVVAGTLPTGWSASVNGNHVEVVGPGIAAGAYTFVLEIEDAGANAAQLPVTVTIE